MKNQIKTILLLGVLSSILIAFGAMLGRQWVAGFTLLALALNLGAYFFSHKIVLRMHGQPVEEHQAPPSTASLFIVNPFSATRGLVSLVSTHPPMDERVRRLRGTTFARYAA